MNLFDKIVYSIDPEKGLKRLEARKKFNILNKGYSEHGASSKKNSLKGWTSKGGTPKEDIEDNLDKLRARSRDLFMGSPLATGAIKTLRTNVVGSGLKFKSCIDAETLGLSPEKAQEIERKIEKEFAYWSESIDCDAARQNNFAELQQLAMLSWLLSGDCFALLPMFSRKNCLYDLRVRLIEADRVCNPKNKDKKDISGGVEVNNNGEVVAFYVAQWHPKSDNFSDKNKDKWLRVPLYGDKTGRRNIIHLMESERPEQRRGVPFLAPVIETLKQLSRYSEAELMAAVVSGMFTIFIKSDTPEVPLGQAIATEDQLEPDDDYNYELGNGAIVGLGENESIQEANPGRPNTAFDGFITSLCRQIGSALEIPPELLVKHFTASYSASRAALLEAWKMFKMRRKWLVDGFCQPIFEEFLSEAVSKGRVEAPGFFEDPLIKKAYCGSEWNGPTQGQLDPLKEVNAATKRIEEGLSTRARETAELTGGDFEVNHRQRVKEEDMRLRDGLIKQENKENA